MFVPLPFLVGYRHVQHLVFLALIAKLLARELKREGDSSTQPKTLITKQNFISTFLTSILFCLFYFFLISSLEGRQILDRVNISHIEAQESFKWRKRSEKPVAVGR